MRCCSRRRSSSVRSGCAIKFSRSKKKRPRKKREYKKGPAEYRGAVRVGIHVVVTTGFLAFFSLVASGPKSIQVQGGYGTLRLPVKRGQAGHPAPYVAA